MYSLKYVQFLPHSNHHFSEIRNSLLDLHGIVSLLDKMVWIWVSTYHLNNVVHVGRITCYIQLSSRTDLLSSGLPALRVWGAIGKQLTEFSKIWNFHLLCNSDGICIRTLMVLEYPCTSSIGSLVICDTLLRGCQISSWASNQRQIVPKKDKIGLALGFWFNKWNAKNLITQLHFFLYM